MGHRCLTTNNCNGADAVPAQCNNAHTAVPILDSAEGGGIRGTAQATGAQRVEVRARLPVHLPE